jgi:hypothetical protein
MLEGGRAMTTCSVNLTDEQLDILESLLGQELETVRVEARRTDNSKFREGVLRRIDMIELILSSIHTAREGSSEPAGLA